MGRFDLTDNQVTVAEVSSSKVEIYSVSNTVLKIIVPPSGETDQDIFTELAKELTFAGLKIDSGLEGIGCYSGKAEALEALNSVRRFMLVKGSPSLGRSLCEQFAALGIECSYNS